MPGHALPSLRSSFYLWKSGVEGYHWRVVARSKKEGARSKNSRRDSRESSGSLLSTYSSVPLCSFLLLLKIPGHIDDELNGSRRLRAEHPKVTTGSQKDDRVVRACLTGAVRDRGSLWSGGPSREQRKHPALCWLGHRDVDHDNTSLGRDPAHASDLERALCARGERRSASRPRRVARVDRPA